MKLGAILGIGTAMFISFSSLLLIFFGMLPTFVAYVIDRSHNRSNTVCVGAANLCGVFPYLLELWLNQHSIAGAMLILTNMFSIAVMYFAAASGWFLFIAIPPAMISVLRVLDQNRVVALKERQKKMLEEWSRAVGEDVKNAKVAKEASASPAQDQPSSTPQATAESVPPPGTPPQAPQGVPGSAP